MTANPLADIVSNQYEQWIYPEPIADLPGWLATHWQWFDPSHAHAILWPDREYRPDLDILVAGCGTNQAAVLAYTNPKAKIVAIDVSQASLNHHGILKLRYGLDNLALHRMPIEEVRQLGKRFDLIISTGVLHHLAVPETGMKALGDCLRPDGVAAIMLYARYGRIGVEMLQALFRDLGLKQNEASLKMVRETLALLPQDHPIRSYMSLAPDLVYDAGLVDTFLHGRDRSYTIGDCFDLVGSAGLVFQDLFLKSPYYPPVDSQSALHTAIASLPEADQWAAMERINFRNACHFFTACRPERSEKSYRIDLSPKKASRLVPTFRYRCGLDGMNLLRPGWSTPLTSEHEHILRRMDGHLTIAGIVDALIDNGTFARRRRSDHLANTTRFFRSLWQLDFVAMRLR